MQQTRLFARARAKVNLSLHITGQRADGFHLLDSLVVFPDIADNISVTAAETLSLRIDGPFAAGLTTGDNLIIKAARLLSARKGAEITLTKNLPLMSGIGGGSSDAATALHLLSQLWNEPLPSIDAQLTLGADVPVCMAQTPHRMRGIGQDLTPIDGVPGFAMVLVNAGIPVATADVFREIWQKSNAPMQDPVDWKNLDHFVEFVKNQRNDMQQAAEYQNPEIKSVIKMLDENSECLMARMSGSGGTCFGIFETPESARLAVVEIKKSHPDWWVETGLV